MQCLKQHWHKYTSTPSMLSPPQMYVPQMWEKKESNPLDNISIKKQKEKEKDMDGKEESPYDQSYGNNEFTIRLPYYLPYPEKQALFLIWMLYQYSGVSFLLRKKKKKMNRIIIKLKNILYIFLYIYI